MSADPSMPGARAQAASSNRPAPLHVVEPTLEDATGHCFSFLDSLCRSAGDHPIAVWGGQAAGVLLPGNVRLRRYFRRRIRRLQAWWLYRKLLREPGRIFVSTAGRADLFLLDFASRGAIAPGKVFLYVHWFRSSPAKERQLARLAARQPEIAIFAPTETICAPFRAAGFKHARVVPYPITPAAGAQVPGAAPAFRHVLFAGAARADKGFAEVVNFVELLAKANGDIPVCLQTSAQHYDKVDAATAASLERLEAIRYPHLVRHPASLSAAEYQALFRGAICLQLYSRSDFADRISGVTLDALSHGSPIVALSGTWMARVVEEFGAGVVLEDPAPEALREAVARLMAGYAHYHRRAWEAGRELQMRNNAGTLFRALTA
jgi:glycosyltransferase involved in cell wall biosynthesis